MSALDEQEGGDHYKKLGDYQPWIVAKKWLSPEEMKGAAKMTAIVYLCRENDKGGRQDIIKAMHTLQIYLELTGAECSCNDPRTDVNIRCAVHGIAAELQARAGRRA